MIIADTGFWVALLFRRDTHHAPAAEAYARFKGQLVTTWPILTETSHLLARRVSPDAAPALLEGAGRAYRIWELPADAAARASLLMRRYAALPMDLADASAVLLAEHLGDGRILSTDRRDVETYRWKHRLPFRNLLLPG
ncbi:MAG: PIN domain-containing protein [Thiohalocapsa sp.]|uniref:type II toxin-antitoxin system VapC family toxin n=1 Tax=Thiohalocapsa sp. TaxID=2497641 RepID=UPI0025F97C9E|nr:PIN domain-containing protein [Thiohalocapsa sp.]MCG6942592.1 PIN domain-containing protein [Thiohalocapsa sp.]